MYQITDVISRDTIFFFIVFLFTGFCNTGSGFGYFQIKSKHKVTLASIAPHEAQVETLRGLWVVQLWVLGPFYTMGLCGLIWVMGWQVLFYVLSNCLFLNEILKFFMIYMLANRIMSFH